MQAARVQPHVRPGGVSQRLQRSRSGSVEAGEDTRAVGVSREDGRPRRAALRLGAVKRPRQHHAASRLAQVAGHRGGVQAGAEHEDVTRAAAV